jgi:hypothetical protein
MNLPFSTVFVSSIQEGFEDVRSAARDGIESLGLRAVMAETAGAAPTSPRNALLTLVASADVFVLIVGPRYGHRGESGRSATEDEFCHARDLGKDILVFVSDRDREPDAEAFLQRVQGGWEQGLSAPRFERADQVVGLIVRSLRELAEQRSDGASAGEAQQRAVDRARGEERRGYLSQGVPLRVAFVPTGSPRLLNDVQLDDPQLPDGIAGEARAAGLVSQAANINVEVTSTGVAISATPSARAGTTEALFGVDGSLTVQTDVRAEGMLGGMQVAHARVVSATESAGRLAQALWGRFDDRGWVRQVAVALAIRDADGKLYVMEQTGSSSRVPMGTPQTVVAPEPAAVLRREDVGTPSATRALAIALKRRFADFGALQE